MATHTAVPVGPAAPVCEQPDPLAPVRLLMLEDRDEDAELVLHELRRAGIKVLPQRADSEESFLRLLSPDFDLILADYALPSFNGISALLAAKRRCPDVPFIFVSGTMGEDVAVEALHYGAVDYVLKHRLSRLGPAVARALRENRLLKERRQADLEKDAILNGLKDVVIQSIDRDFKLLWGNRALTAERGAPTDGFCERFCGRFNPNRLEHCSTCSVAAALRTGNPAESEIETPDKRTYMLRSVPVRDASDRIAGAITIALNFTQQKKLQNQFIQAQKMEAIGALAGGLAHDLGNELTVILCLAQMLIDKKTQGEKLASTLRTINESATHAARLTQQLLMFGRRSQLQPAAVNLPELLKSLAGMIAPLVGENIRASILYPPADATIWVDSFQFQQALLNLAANARDAMPNGGTLTIDASQPPGPRFQSAHPHLDPARYLGLQVSDTGTGMTPDVRARLFEPFFTTKPPGQGTGLGLAMVHEFIQQSNGFIDVDSTPGQGTSFYLYFLRSHASPMTATPLPATSLRHDRRTILLVEDESVVREVMAKALRDADFEVLEAPDAHAAFAAFQSHQDDIDIIVTDVVMPGPSGIDLANQIHDTGSTLPILFISGSAQQLRQRWSSLPHAEVLPKPFSHPALIDKVRQLTNAPPAS